MELVSDSVVYVRFDEPQDAITPGQGCVFYDGSRVLGGGWISPKNNYPRAFDPQTRSNSKISVFV